jgi:hypothetical protein
MWIADWIRDPGGQSVTKPENGVACILYYLFMAPIRYFEDKKYFGWDIFYPK